MESQSLSAPFPSKTAGPDSLPSFKPYCESPEERKRLVLATNDWAILAEVNPSARVSPSFPPRLSPDEGGTNIANWPSGTDDKRSPYIRDIQSRTSTMASRSLVRPTIVRGSMKNGEISLLAISQFSVSVLSPAARSLCPLQGHVADR